MRNPDHFDPLQIGRYSVIKVWWEFPGQRPEEKYFVVLRHGKNDAGDTVCWCIKPTCRVGRYEAEADLMKGVVYYPRGTFAFFSEDTVIDPHPLLEIPHLHLKKESGKRYRLEGKLPAEFHSLLVTAIRNSDTLEPKMKRHILSLIGESL